MFTKPEEKGHPRPAEAIDDHYTLPGFEYDFGEVIKLKNSTNVSAIYYKD